MQIEQKTIMRAVIIMVIATLLYSVYYFIQPRLEYTNTAGSFIQPNQDKLIFRFNTATQSIHDIEATPNELIDRVNVSDKEVEVT